MSQSTWDICTLHEEKHILFSTSPVSLKNTAIVIDIRPIESGTSVLHEETPVLCYNPNPITLTDYLAVNRDVILLMTENILKTERFE
jgi:hypothetical protein